eukprot:CAMPEP_0118905972 /NCGR_PEP_ID=MMETSP1166-20130328/9714_1 /TAXON_ID=1104430 /ORGANISM="Chrysoreinhardia sp, Strain CCMP3193" /LENGTH=448 /DNA_ID=CAMNT_0006845243 /DNA_START=195 /DNA_END=1541 /DNA_ORIENTATION=-
MAALLNIAGTTPIEDPEYRYKMPRLVGKVEGRGNGIKTAIPNMTSIAAALHRPPGEVTKFFGCELGAQTTWTEDTERAIVNGAHATQVLQEKLSIYVEKFVLCPSCKLPETSYKIRSEIIYHACVACGAREPVDMQHKLTTYILKQHKLEKKSKAAEEGGGAGKKKKADKADKADKEGKSSKSKKGSDKLTDAEKAEKKRKKKEKKAREAAAAAAGGEDDDDDGGRVGGGDRKEEDLANPLDDDDDDDDLNDDDQDKEEDEDDSEEPEFEDDASAMHSAVAGLKTKLEDNPTPSEIVGEARAVQKFCALPRNERAYILLAAYYFQGHEGKLLEKPSSRDKAILGALLKDVGHLSVIAGLEKLAVLTDDTSKLVSKFPIVLKLLYDHDVLDESHVLQWHAKAVDGADKFTDISDTLTDDKRAKILKASEPFVVWLQQADEEDDDDDEED